MRRIKVGFFGTRGVPASYSGFETFYEKLLWRIPKDRFECYVFNRLNYVQYPFRTYKGARVIGLPTIAQKHLDTISHTFFSLLYAVLRGLKPDVALICNVGNSTLLPLFKIFGIKTILNVDGQDWRRQKWERFASWYLKTSEKIASLFADVIVADSLEVFRYYLENHRVDEKRLIYIPYGGITPEDLAITDIFGEDEELLRRFGLERNRYFLFVGRLVPENSPHVLISAFRRAKSRSAELRDFRAVIVGDAPYAERYKAFLREIAEGDSHVVFTGYLFSSGYVKISRNAFSFVLCARVGGTHPVLVEQMSLGNLILCYDTPSNREVLGDAGLFFESEERLVELMVDSLRSDLGELRIRAKQRAEEMYSWDKIAERYIALFERLASGTV